MLPKNKPMKNQNGQIIFALLVVLFIALIIFSNLWLINKFNRKLILSAKKEANSERIVYDIVKSSSDFPEESISSKFKVDDYFYSVKTEKHFFLTILSLEVKTKNSDSCYRFFWGQDVPSAVKNSFIEFADSPYKLRIDTASTLINGSVVVKNTPCSEFLKIKKVTSLYFNDRKIVGLLDMIKSFKKSSTSQDFSEILSFSESERKILGPGVLNSKSPLFIKGEFKNKVLIYNFCQIKAPEIYIENAECSGLVLLAKKVNLQNVEGDIQIIAQKEIVLENSILKNPSVVVFDGTEGKVVIRNSRISGSVLIIPSEKENVKLNTVVENAMFKGVGIFKTGVLLKKKNTFSGAFQFDYVYYYANGMPVYNKLKGISLLPLKEKVIVPFSLVSKGGRKNAIFVFKE